MKEKLEQLKKEFDKAIGNSVKKEDIEQIRVAFLGKKGALTSIMKEMRDFSLEKKKEVGQMVNAMKSYIEESVFEYHKNIDEKEIATRLNKEWVDISWPAYPAQGTVHPVSTVRKELEDLFTSMGFEILDGPEMENEYNNFMALNIPEDHPARDTQDTFWLKNGMLLRTHTSPVQIRGMEKRKPPFKFIAPGKTYRNEATDASHEHTFHQIEGMVVDRDISVANLIYTLKAIISNIFGREVEVRLRPSYFPFVEPGFELDFRCQICSGKGCSVCKQSGWIEYLGCGMIHPNVLKNGGIDTDEFQGFAFGGGIERLVMMKYGIDDIRHFHSGDLRFLKQF